jgi:uncharacterized membrane protein
MKLGAISVGNLLYDLYGNISHQYAHRSVFLYGEQLAYAPEDLPVTLSGEYAADFHALREFRGNAEVGWKMAWSDRLAAMFGSMLVVFVAFAIFRWKRFPLWLGILLVLPLILDGATHYAADYDGMVGNWRYDNGWLASLTGHAFAESFYVGDTIGTFNSWMRWITGILFGIGFFGWGLPVADRYFERNEAILTQKLADWRRRQAQPTPSTAET